MSDPKRALMVYDGDCGFCRRWIDRWRLASGDRVDYQPFQLVADRHPEIPRERFAEAVHFRSADGKWSRGAEAVFRARASGTGGGAALWIYTHLPPFRVLSESAYRFVARRRPLATRVSDALWGGHVVPPGERLTVWLLARVFGAIALAAFLSLWVQIVGLVGQNGILPAADLLARTHERYGAPSVYLLPTLLWLHPGDAMLHLMCGAGAAASLALALGFLPGPSALAIAVLYLSLAVAGQEFLWFQWDGLLIETAVVLALLLPWRLQSRAATDPPPPRSALRLARWLLLRLMFSSAVVKLASGDPAWRNLTALQFHYETQPLPIWTAWYAHHLPPAFQSFSAAVMFSIEGLAPWCVLLPRRPRIAAAASIVGLQLLIAATGNYGIFNALAIALCLVYVDDGFWPKWVRRLAGFETAPDGALARPARGRAHRLVRRPLAIALVLLSVVPLWSALRFPVAPLGPLRVAYVLAQPFRVVNPYGLFAVMTTTRPEIVIEGSDDGQVWRAYEFPFKAGDPNRRPGFVAPHMPRLDWQMWFAALGDWRGETWVFYFLDRLLHGEPRVLALLARNPFPDHPPRFVRTVRYLYRFTTAAERRRTGAWWTRELEGAWAPALTLKDGRLAPMVEPAP